MFELILWLYLTVMGKPSPDLRISVAPAVFYPCFGVLCVLQAWHHGREAHEEWKRARKHGLERHLLTFLVVVVGAGGWFVFFS